MKSGLACHQPRDVIKGRLVPSAHVTCLDFCIPDAGLLWMIALAVDGVLSAAGGTNATQLAPHVVVCLEQSSAAAIAAAPLPCLPLPRSVTPFHSPVCGYAPAASSWVFAVQWRSTPQNGNFGFGMPV